MVENITKVKSGIMPNVDVSVKNICEKDCIWNPATCSCKNGTYLPSITDDSVIAFDEIIDADAKAKSDDKETKTILKNIICETKSFYILLAFLLSAITLLIAVTIYCYLIKYKPKQKHFITILSHK